MEVLCPIPGTHVVGVVPDVPYHHYDIGDTMWCPPGHAMLTWCDDYWQEPPPPGQTWSEATVLACPPDPAANVIAVPEPDGVLMLVAGLLTLLLVEWWKNWRR